MCLPQYIKNSQIVFRMSRNLQVQIIVDKVTSKLTKGTTLINKGEYRGTDKHLTNTVNGIKE